MKQISLSVALATYNEERDLARCLESVKDIADEIVVVDGSSEDKTREIARHYAARIIRTTNKPIFHINKQMAIDKCRGRWILQLDADEVVEKALVLEIRNIVKSDSSHVAYYLPRKNFFLGRWLRKTGQYPDPVIRLFKKGFARLPCRSVHEQMEVNGSVGYLKNHLLHYPYPTFSDYFKKSNRYTTLQAQQMIEEGQKPTVTMFWQYFFRFHTTWLKLFFRHRGFQDGFPGFVFSFYSGLHQLTSYIKFWEFSSQKRKANLSQDWE